MSIESLTGPLERRVRRRPSEALARTATEPSPLTGKYGDVLTPFVTLMEKELHANAGKGDRAGWLAMSPAVAMLEIYYHAAKLQKAVKDDAGPHIQEYAADVANMAMMLLDLCGGLVRVDSASQKPPHSERGDAPECHKLDTPARVFFYEQDFYVLSNFSSFRVRWRGIDFDTSEHAYHWAKFDGTEREVQDMILEARSAHDAFKIAESQRMFRRDNWDAEKVPVMREIIRAKVEQHEYVRRKLLATGDRELVEDSWRDDFWGWGPNRDGSNMLGKLWMGIRIELREAAAAEVQS